MALNFPTGCRVKLPSLAAFVPQQTDVSRVWFSTFCSCGWRRVIHHTYYLSYKLYVRTLRSNNNVAARDAICCDPSSSSKERESTSQPPQHQLLLPTDCLSTSWVDISFCQYASNNNNNQIKSMLFYLKRKNYVSTGQTDSPVSRSADELISKLQNRHQHWIRSKR